MNKIYLIKPDIYLFAGILLAIITAITVGYSYFLLFIFALYLGHRIWGDKVLLFFSIILYLTFISDVIHSARLYIQIIGFLILLYIFIKRFGFDVKKFPRVPKIILRFLVLLYFSMVISTIFSKYFFTGIEQITKQSVFFIIIFLVYSFLDKIVYIKTILAALAFATVVVTISILYEYILNGFNIVDYVGGTQIRMTGILTNINAAGSYLGAIFPISLAIKSLIKEKKNRILLDILNFIFFIGIIFTTSRSTYLSILISSLFVYYMLNKKMLVKISISLAVIAIIIIIMPQLNDFFSLFFRLESGISQRDHLWALSFKMIKDHPFFGIGPGAYSYEMLNYLPVLLNTWVGEQLVILRDITFGANNSHNFFLFFASDMGIPGIITSIIFPLIFLKVGVENIKKYRGSNFGIYTLTIGIVAGGLGLFFRGFFEGIGLITYGWITMDLPFWLIFITLISLYINDFGIVENSGLTFAPNDL